MANRERTVTLRVMVTEEEAQKIKENMTLTGTNNFSMYARKMLLDGYVVVRDFAPFKEVAAAMGAIARNLYQIAKRANETRSVYADDLEDIKTAYYREWKNAKTQLMKLIKETRQGNGIYENTPNHQDAE